MRLSAAKRRFLVYLLEHDGRWTGEGLRGFDIQTIEALHLQGLVRIESMLATEPTCVVITDLGRTAMPGFGPV